MLNPSAGPVIDRARPSFGIPLRPPRARSREPQNIRHL